MNEGPFVGREGELATLDGLLCDLCEGRGGVAIVVGESGIGKTRLLREFEARARQSGVATCWGRASEHAGAPAFWAWIRALRPLVASTDWDRLRLRLPDASAELRRLFPVELARAGEDSEQPVARGGEAAQFMLFEAVAVLLTAAAESQPLLVVLDDLQWADRSTLLLLAHVAAEVADAPILIAGACREGPRGGRQPFDATLANLARIPRLEVIELEGLDAPSVGAYVEAVVGSGASRSLGEEIHTRTEGHPFYVGEITRWLGKTPDSDHTGTRAVPSTIRALLAQRLAALSAEIREALRVAAIVGRAFDAVTVGHVLDTDSQLVWPLLEEARGARILDEGERFATYQFHHALTHEAVLEELSSNRKALLHEAVAVALARSRPEDPGLVAELAFHYREASGIGPEVAARALRWSKRAGEEAEAQSAWDEAAAQYEHCLALLPLAGESGEDEVELLSRLGGAQARSSAPFSELDTARRLIESLNARSDMDRLARALAAFRETNLPRETEAALVEQVRSLLGETSPHLVAEVLIAAGAREPDERSDEWLSEAEQLVRTHGLEDLAPALLQARGRRFQQLGDFDAAVALHGGAAEGWGRRGDYEQAGWALVSLSQIVNTRGPVEDLPVIADELDAYAKAHGVSALLGQAFTARTAFELGRGRLAPLKEGEPEERFQSFVVFATLQALFRGDLARAGELVSHRAWHVGNSIYREPMKAWIALERGEVQEAKRHWTRFRQVAATRGLPARRSTLGAFAQAALLEFLDKESCEFILETPPDYRLVVGLHSWDCAKGVAAFKLGRLEVAEQAFLRGGDWAQQARYPVQEGRAWHGLALVAEARGETAEALRHCESALALFERAEAGLYAGHARALRDRLLGAGGAAPCRGPATLTEREAEVLALVARGLTNPQIAELLTLSTTTVASHVASILNKTGLSNRVEAAAYAVRNGLA